jgi:hypothetical protein
MLCKIALAISSLLLPLQIAYILLVALDGIVLNGRHAESVFALAVVSWSLSATMSCVAGAFWYSIHPRGAGKASTVASVILFIADCFLAWDTRIITFSSAILLLWFVSAVMDISVIVACVAHLLS